MTGFNWNAFDLFKKKKSEDPAEEVPPQYLLVKPVNNKIYNIKVPDHFRILGYRVDVTTHEGHHVYQAQNINLNQWLIDLTTHNFGSYNVTITSGLQSVTKTIDPEEEE